MIDLTTIKVHLCGATEVYTVGITEVHVMKI